MNLDLGADDDPTEGTPSNEAEERDLLVVLRLSNRQMGTNDERADIALLAEDLAAKVEEAGLGEYDGDEYGGGECILFFCGPNEMELLGFLRSLLQHSRYARGAHFVRLIESSDGEMKRENIPM
ncbi:MAG: hypothetical protein ACI8UD_002290 [Planctomycetota bacterium]|jgi:hypothetical protein